MMAARATAAGQPEGPAAVVKFRVPPGLRRQAPPGPGGSACVGGTNEYYSHGNLKLTVTVTLRTSSWVGSGADMLPLPVGYAAQAGRFKLQQLGMLLVRPNHWQ